MDSPSPSRAGGKGGALLCHLFVSDSGRWHHTCRTLAHFPQPNSRAPPTGFGQKLSPRLASDGFSPNARTHGVFGDPRGPHPAKSSRLWASPTCCTTLAGPAPGNPALAGLREAAPSRWSGQAGTTACRTGLRGEGQARHRLLALQSPPSSAPSPTMEATKAWGGSGLLPDRHPVRQTCWLHWAQVKEATFFVPCQEKEEGKRTPLRSPPRNLLLFLQKLFPCLTPAER